MRKITIILCALLLNSLGFAQSHGTFDNHDLSGNSYQENDNGGGVSEPYFFTEASTTGADTDQNYSSNEPEPNGYGDYTGQKTIVVHPGQDVDYSIIANKEGTIKVWVDKNKNGSIEEDELILSSENSMDNLSGSFHVSEDAYLGDYLLRITGEAADNSGNLDDENCSVTLYDGDDFDETDDYITVEPGDYPDLSDLPGADKDWNNEADSFIVGENTSVTMYSETNYEGDSQEFGPGQYSGDDAMEASSMKITCNASDNQQSEVLECLIHIQEGFIYGSGRMSVPEQAFDSFTFYPNPTNGEVNLKAGQAIEEVMIYNMLGQQVFNLSPNTLESQLELQALESGIYMMNIQIDGHQKTFRILKQ